MVIEINSAKEGFHVKFDYEMPGSLKEAVDRYGMDFVINRFNRQLKSEVSLHVRNALVIAKTKKKNLDTAAKLCLEGWTPKVRNPKERALTKVKAVLKDMSPEEKRSFIKALATEEKKSA